MNAMGVSNNATQNRKSSSTTGDLFVRGVSVLIGGRFTIKVIQFARTIIIARLLFPEDVGLFGMAALAIGFIDVFFQSGFYHAIVQEKGDVRRYLDTAWTGQLLRNLFIAALTFFSAPYIANYFAHHELTPLIQVLSLSVAIVGFQNIGVVLLQKEMRFGRQYFFDIFVVFADAAVVIIAGVIYGNVWALVMGSVANRIVAVILSYIVHPYRPSFLLRKDDLQHLFQYGKWVSLGGLVTYLVSRGDAITVGKFLGAEQLGYYQPALALALLPVLDVGRTLGMALFPMFARINSGAYADVFMRVARPIFALTIPATIGIVALAQYIVPIVYGEKWIPMAPLVSILAFYGFFRSFEVVGQPFFNGIGKPHISTMSLVVQLSTIVLFIVPIVSLYGTHGAAWVMVMSGFFASIVYIFFLLRYGVVKYFDFLGLFSAPLLAGGAMFMLLRLVTHYIYINSGTRLFSAVVFGAGSYACVLWIVDRVMGGQLFAVAQDVRRRMLLSRS